MIAREREKAFDTAIAALSNQYRRQLLVALLEHNPQDDDDRDPLNLLSEEEEATVLKTELVHNHLPKLEEMGYITWDRATHKISKGPEWNEIAPLLKLIDDHKNELPEGWL